MPAAEATRNTERAAECLHCARPLWRVAWTDASSVRILGRTPRGVYQRYVRSAWFVAQAWARWQASGNAHIGTTGRIRLEGVLGECSIDSVAVPDDGSVSLNDHTGWVPLGAAIVSLIREPAR